MIPINKPTVIKESTSGNSDKVPPDEITLDDSGICKKSCFAITITLTWSKITSMLILLGGCTIGVIFKDVSLVQLSILSSITLLGVKQLADIWKPKNTTLPYNGKD